ncbi:DNA primase [Ferrimonas balearica]|uniref:DNA primase n=1 Tax=Ferrimonas balearica TaxID=44012 RepID=UPI001C99A156|nr:DNA primase [Ferrimonas balearica]MBY5995158.1 DNA primase [Ferrimonas balearica]
MAGRIPRDFIDQLLSRLDIVELIDGRVKLKKAGKNYHACCPFHNEKTPSFTVSQDKQFYHCFGCGAHGNAIDFVMEYDRLEFVDAIEELAGQMGLEVPRESSGGRGGRSHQGGGSTSKPAQGPKLDDHYTLMSWAARYYQQQLRQHPERDRIIEYLKKRGLDGETVQRFGIGFAPPGWDNLLAQQRSSNSAQKLLAECGMLIEKEGGKRYDRFRDRLMFPIQDRRGRVIAFGGRVLGDDTPKYLNSPETPIFHKGRELYGLYPLRQNNRNPERVLVVEGYMDVVALAQHGIDYAVASLGTSTTADHIQVLMRTASKEVVCCYDGDRAGRDAAWRALETALPMLKSGKALKFMFLPDGEDPDTLVRKEGKEAFEARIAEAMPLSDYLFGHLSQDAELSSAEGKASFINTIRPLIDQIGDEVLRETLIQRLEKTLGWGARQHFQAPRAVAKPQQKAQQGRGTPIRRAVALLLQNPRLGYQLEPQVAVAHLPLGGIALLRGMLDACRDAPLTTAQLLERYRGSDEYGTLRKLLGWNMEVEEHLDKEFFDCLQWLNQRFLEHLSETLQQKARDGSITVEETRKLSDVLTILKRSPKASGH